MVMTLNSRRRWCFISRYNVRRTFLLTILFVWCSVCGGTSPATAVPTPTISQTAGDVCVVKTKASITMPMTSTQNPKCTPVTFTVTLPTTTLESLMTTGVSTENATSTTADVSPTTFSVLPTSTVAPPTEPSSTTEASTTAVVTPTTPVSPSATTANAVETTTAAALVSTSEGSTTTAETPTTVQMFSEITTSFLATTSLQNATTQAETPETQNPVSTTSLESSAPTIIIVTQETTMPLSVSSPTTVVPLASTTNIATQTIAVVTSRLVFNSSSPVPSEALVLNAIKNLTTFREAQLNETVKIVNVTYEKISETSYAVILTFNLSNVSMPEDPVLRNSTYRNVQGVVNNALNTLLNDPHSPVLQPKYSNFTTSLNQIEGIMGYTFQEGDAIQPVSFLNELSQKELSTTTVHPETISSSFVTPSNTVSGSAVVTSRLVFNSSSPVPSEALVLNAIKTLRNSRESQLNDSVKIVNVTYEKISETSYAVIFTFSLINISMPEDLSLRNNPYQQVQDVINNALNTLLNEPNKEHFAPKFNNLMSTSNQIEGMIEYTFQEGDAIQPVSFLKELQSQTELITTTLTPKTTSSSSVTLSNLVSGSAVVTSRLVFNSSSPVPSEALVLNAIKNLTTSRKSQLNESVKIVNVTYEKISETSYAAIFTFNLISVSMPEDSKLRNDTYQKVKNTINDVLNTLLNEPEKQHFEPASFNFMSTSNQIEGIIGYTFQEGDAIQPVSFLNELSQKELSTTTVHPETISSSFVTPSNTVSGLAVVTSRLVFSSSSPVPSETLVLSAIKNLRNSREAQLNESVKIVNVTYQKISETSYAVIFTFNLINISMPEDLSLRNNTYQQVQDVINNALNILLNEPNKQHFAPKFNNLMSTSNQIEGMIGYTFQEGDAIQPVSFLNELKSQTELITTTLTPKTTSSSSVTLSNLVSGSAVVTSRLVFNSSSPVPSEALVLNAIKNLTTSRKSQLNESVKIVNVTYEKISETSYAAIFTFNLISVSMPEDSKLRNDTYQKVKNTINYVLNTLLNEPEKQHFEPASFNFMSTSNQIEGIIGYTFQEGDAIQPVSFLNELSQKELSTTTVHPETISSSSVTPSNTISGSAVVTSRLVFSSSAPVPSEALVLNAIKTLRNSRESQLNESVKIVNVTYEKISETSYAVIFTFNLINISMPEDLSLRNNPYQQVQDVINNALNTLLNEPNKQHFAPKFNNLMSTSNQIEGMIGYTFQEGDAIQPVSFLKELQSQTELITTTLTPKTTSSSSVTLSNLVSGSAVVTSRLVFNSSSPVPSEALVLNAIKTLNTSRAAQLNESVKIVNVTYEKISETSYAAIFTFNLISVSMPEDSKLRNDTYQKVKNTINDVLNTLLNEPEKQHFEPASFNFMSTSNQIEGIIGYTFQEGDAIQPVSFLNELSQKELSTTTVHPETISSSFVTPSNTVSGSAVVTSRLVFSSSSPVPSEALVLNAIKTLRNSRESQLNDSVKIVNVTYEKISETSYAVIFTFNLINISMPENLSLRNNTYQQVQDVINNALNILLNEPNKQHFAPKFNNLMSTSNQIEGMIGYTFQEGDAIQPVSFLKELQSQTELITTTLTPKTTSSSSVTLSNLVSGSAVVRSRLVFNSSSPVPNKTLVLNAISTLLFSRESQLNGSVKIVNVTYEKISETSYAAIFTFNLISVSMPEDSKLRNDTYQKVKNTINDVLNTLLNEPEKQHFEPASFNFMSTSNQIEGIIGYTFQEGDAIQPVSFLNELSQKELSTTTVHPETISSSFVTPSNTVSGSAVVTSRLVFSSSSPVPSEALVLNAIKTLRNSRESQLNDSVKIVNVTYEKISETSYAVIFTFNLINISMPEDLSLRNNTYQKVQDVINNALNTLLNEPNKQHFAPKFNNLMSTSNQIEGIMGYTFQERDAIQPVSFLKELQSQKELSTTTVHPETISSSSVTPSNTVSGSAVVTSRLVFNSSSPVPSEALVLNAIKTLRNSRESQLNESVKVVNVTYEKISEISYVVTFKFNVTYISMPKDSGLRNNTYLQLQDVINNALNTLMNEPGRPSLKPKSSNFMSTLNQIDGSMDYIFQKNDVIQPVSFLQQLSLLTVTTTTSSSTTTTISPPTLYGKVKINIRLVFNTRGTIPTAAYILQLVNTSITPRFQTKDTAIQNVNLQNITFIRISDTSYAVDFEFAINNVSMSEKLDLRNDTKVSITSSINNLISKILNDPTAPKFDMSQVGFTDNSTEILASVQYVYSDTNINTNSTLIQDLLIANGVLTTASTLTTTVTSSPTILGKVIIYISLVFKTRGTLPSQSNVLDVANSLLIKMNLRTKRDITTRELQDLVSSVNVSYTKLNETSFSLNFGFEISNVSMSEKQELRNETYTVIKSYINSFVSQILNKTVTTDFNFNQIAFKNSSSVIEANVTYVFTDSDISNFGLVFALLGSPTTPAPTTYFPTVLNTTVSGNSTNAAWVVAIIVPCAIVIILLPCWILLCCLLCGCCAAIRRRWHRRHSYNVQYTTRNSLF